MKFKTKWKKILTFTISTSLGILLLGTGKVEAALQSNYATHTKEIKKRGSVWIQEIREMETAGQTMGLSETINEDLTPTTSNGIDVHMMKSTEYGAVAILSVSGFGYNGMLQDAPVKSTTGNVTGVYFAENRSEWTAGTSSEDTIGKDARYYDLYTTKQTSAKVGDALGLDTYVENPGCSGWHASSGHSWLSSGRAFRRGGNSIFYYYGGSTGTSAVWSGYSNYGRGVAVIGENL